MAVRYSNLGPGTLTLTFPAGSETPKSHAAYLVKAGIKHAYEDVGDAVTYLDASKDSPIRTRASDVFEGQFHLNLDATELYDMLQTNDLGLADLEFVPNTAQGAKFKGVVQLQLPEGVEWEKFGAKATATIALTCKEATGTFVWTANTPAP